MKYYFLIKDTEIIGAGQCPCSSEGCICIEVTQEQYNLAQEKGNNYFIYQDEKLIVNPNYEDEKIKERKQKFYADFFNTSLGYIRRKVTMANGETKDFLSDLLPTISMGVSLGEEVKVIAYNEPDFTQEVIDWESLQHNEVVTSIFIQECFTQLSNDFGVINERTTDTVTV